ncbi:MAG TPA: tRNA epoxyqueuosine(34) reductase QueG [Blastocatellia bacterium]|nr:tRNA epoxyqueuosine(34) reductase QueG [Blastocatellia bacterium]HMV83781.1 tRNA epoxyqueuosine(34) reductase QueG [Blastocatellia bacterium]HMX27812.1 tRNA epoxyqueuosine(34) reductase QueG [Blastocatellia bacterium]HMY72841.1 tRNA epoxyqueuosine(34) reductase QueG [Blastocatellia bacterium]HMZ20867.1 tRNA epoxyqueuosine(34) reductase QueG [Blastocatellia bacterium]
MVKLQSKDIKQQALELGFNKVGIVPAAALTEEGARLQQWLARGFHGQMNYMARDPQQRSDPRLLLTSAKSVVCVALNYFRPEKHSGAPDTGKISRYAWGEDYHDVLRDKLKALLAWIQEQQPEVEGKICVDSSPMMDKAWAVRAGIGWLGKHSNVITKEFGSWIFLGELLLSVELDYDSFIEPDHCGKCTACLDACPTGAIIAPYQVDGTRCISYGTIELREPELPEPIKSNLEGWVFGCDICQDVCPWSRFSKETAEARFAPREGIIEPKLLDLIELSQEEFSARFRKSPVKRAKLAGLKRNAKATQQTQHKPDTES